HRIRMDVPNPLPWDLGWLLVFGLLPLFAGLWLRRRADPHGGGQAGGQAGGHGMALLLAAAVVTAAVFNPGARRKAPADTAAVVATPRRSARRRASWRASWRPWYGPAACRGRSDGGGVQPGAAAQGAR